MRGRLVVLLWALTRLFMLVALLTFGQRVVGDIGYYRKSLEAMSRLGAGHTLTEYPLPALGVVAAPWAVTQHFGAAAYGMSIIGLVLITDAIYTRFLNRRSRGGQWQPVIVWLLATPALGAVGLARFDILPGVLVGAMVLLYERRPRLAATALSVAACIKLWPCLLVVPLLATVRIRIRVLGVIVGIGAACVVATAALTSWWRVVSPLIYQGRRGLQIETVAATPAMVAAKLPGAHYRIWFAPSKAYEITGPGTGTLLAVTTVASVALLVFLVALWWRLLRPARRVTAEELVWSVLAATSGFIVLGRVFSPQYLLWLAPVAAAGLVVSEAGEHGRALSRWSAALLLTMGLTQLVFPVLYSPMVLPRSDTWLALTVLAARNVSMLVLFMWSARRAWWLTRHGQERVGATVASSELRTVDQVGATPG